MQQISGRNLRMSVPMPWLIAALVAGAGVCAFAGARRITARMREQRGKPRATMFFDAIDRDSEDSFPASDPPSFTPINGIRAGAQ
jgi:hypothetical protein